MITQPQPFQTFILIRKILMSFKMLLQNNTAVKNSDADLYRKPQADSPVFLEVKSKDEEGIGHKFRLVATSQAIINLMTDGTVDHQIQDPDLVQEIQRLRKRYGHRLEPRMFIIMIVCLSKKRNPFRVILIRRFAWQSIKT